MPPIRLVTFDILHTLITPRHPIHVQYSMAFAPYLGHLDPDAVKRSFKIALKTLQRERPSYAYESAAASERWWSEVIEKTALGAGADPLALNASLDRIVPSLMKRFSSSEGYAAFQDALPTIRRLHEEKIFTAVISNSDSRSRLVLKDLKFPEYITPIVLSEEEGIEKPNKEIFRRALSRVNEMYQTEIRENECLHVGDDLESDYEGAVGAGMEGLLLVRRLDGDQEHEQGGDSGMENNNGVRMIQSLEQVIEYV